MAKTKRQKAWGVFDSSGILSQTKTAYQEEDRKLHIVAVTRDSARNWRQQGLGETVRPVTISWEVEE